METSKDWWDKDKEWLNMWSNENIFDACKNQRDKEILNLKDALICKECGFPKEMEREPIIITNDIVSIACFLTDEEDNRCIGCGHLKDGSTLKPVHKFWQKLGNDIIARKNREMQPIKEKILAYLDDLRKSNEQYKHPVDTINSMIEEEIEKIFKEAEVENE